MHIKSHTINNMNAKGSALGKKIGNVAKSVTNKVGSVLASPKTTYFGIKKASADTDTDILKTARQFKGAPKFEPGKGATDAFKYQSAAEGVKAKRSALQKKIK